MQKEDILKAAERQLLESNAQNMMKNISNYFDAFEGRAIKKTPPRNPPELF